MKLLQINTVVGNGSTGRIVEEIGCLAIDNGWKSWIAFGRGRPTSNSNLIRIGNDWDMRFHGLQSRLLDNHGLSSKRVTNKFIDQIKDIKPDIIHLHNIHGYYINYPILFNYLKEWTGSIVWTWHDIWPLTGHCAFFGKDTCDQWMSGCKKCTRRYVYPASWLCSRSYKNLMVKESLFSSLPNLTIVTASEWLAEMQRKSLIRCKNVKVIHNGVDLIKFSPVPKTHNLGKYVLAISNVWTEEKGFNDLIELRKILKDDIDIKLVGVSLSQMKYLPKGIYGIERTSNFDELKCLYSNAIALINPTWGDNFPTVNLESLACGTPVVTYRTGGSPESIDENTGIVVAQGDIQGLKFAIENISNSETRYSKFLCRRRAEEYFDKDICFKSYLQLYDDLLSGSYKQ